MFVTFTRCEWGGGARRLIKAAGMLIGRGRRRRPLCSARSHWASVAPVKGQRSDLKSVTLTPLHLCPSIHTHRLSHFAPPPTSILPPEEKWNLFLASPISYGCLIRWLAPPTFPNPPPGVFDPIFSVGAGKVGDCVLASEHTWRLVTWS